MTARHRGASLIGRKSNPSSKCMTEDGKKPHNGHFFIFSLRTIEPGDYWLKEPGWYSQSPEILSPLLYRCTAIYIPYLWVLGVDGGVLVIQVELQGQELETCVVEWKPILCSECYYYGLLLFDLQHVACCRWSHLGGSCKYSHREIKEMPPKHVWRKMPPLPSRKVSSCHRD